MDECTYKWKKQSNTKLRTEWKHIYSFTMIDVENFLTKATLVPKYGNACTNLLFIEKVINRK